MNPTNPIAVKNEFGHYVSATPKEALQYALTCQRCKGKGIVDETCQELKAKGERKHACVPGCRPSDCPSCVDGIPRWAIETAKTTIKETFKTREHWEIADESAEAEALAVLVALRDRKETE